MNFVHDYNPIIGMLMIKNESKIIQRCLEHILPFIDAISILDTGSTDNTIEICNIISKKYNKPFLITTESFKNFGYNRTISFIKAQQLCDELKWDREKTYMLAIDADMILCPSPEFKSYRLTHNGYNIIQNNGNMKYYNTRFMLASYPWKCIGSTHEYWSGDPVDKLPYELIYIDDKNDGGCKSDKYQRDIRLLTEDITENPNNERSHFYLAQTLKDTGQFKESIQMYKKRIEIGGWREEVWYSYYQIGKCYEHLNKIHHMELWMNLAFDYYPDRAEPIYYLTKYFREKSQHHKSYHYYLKGRSIPFPKNDLLFIEHHVYQGLFDYENTILACYVNGKTKYDSLYDIVSYINKQIPHFIDNVWDNLHYYVENIRTYGEYSRYLIPPHHNYRASSCSIIQYHSPFGKYLMNIRYVNYIIDHKGCYHMSCADGHVRTKNGYVFLNESYQVVDNVIMLEEEYKKCNSNIEGLEDIRLFYHQNELHCISSCKDITDDERIVITIGKYNVNSNKITNLTVTEGIGSEMCQKNWIYTGGNSEMNFIYGWHPLQIGNIINGRINIHTSYPTPSLFSRFRGSSPIVDYLSKKYAVVHLVKYSQPRSYYHSIIQFNKDFLPEAFTLPFCFCDTKIEYCLGFDLKGDSACFIFSQNDMNPSKIIIPFSKLRFISI